MAKNVTDWVWENSRAVNGALIVLLAIAHEAGRDGNAAMSVRQIAAKTRLSERSVKGALIDLDAAAELEAPSKAARGGVRDLRVIMTSRADIAHLAVQNLHTSDDGSSGPDSASRAISAHQEANQPRSEARCADIARQEPEQPDPSRADIARHEPDTPQVAAPPEASRAKSAPLKTSDMSFTSTGTSEVQVKNASEVGDRADVDRLCRHLADRVAGNGSKRPDITKRWRDAARLLMDRDGRTEQQVHIAIDWCQDHEFWRANVLSMPKLREKYDQLRLQASRSPAPSANGRLADRKKALKGSMDRARAVEARNETNGNGPARHLHQSGLPSAGY